MAGIGRHVSRLGGYAPALPTPFGDSGDLDVAALQRLCRRQLEEGATALVVCETAGEAPTLGRTEHHTIVSVAAGVAQREIPVIAGAGSNSTRQAVELARDAEVAGADAILSIVPYYNKPTQAGMYAHFRAIAESTSLPVILYDVPSRTVCGLADETIARLAKMPQIISRMRPATSRGRSVCGHWSGRVSDYYPATTRRRPPFWPTAATAAFRSPRMWRPVFAVPCIWPGSRAKSHAPSGSPRWPRR